MRARSDSTTISCLISENGRPRCFARRDAVSGLDGRQPGPSAVIHSFKMAPHLSGCGAVLLAEVAGIARRRIIFFIAILKPVFVKGFFPSPDAAPEFHE